MASEPPQLVPDEPELKEPPPLAAKANDLEALRTAVVDAAGVGAGLWVSYLFVLFYMLVAAGGITHKDMFFESPVKLPFLNVDLPLTGFFWLGPALFLIVHAYVLLHFVMLAGKVSAFDSALRDQIDNAEVRGRLRRQLPSNIFVQFLAGPQEVRDGVMGVLLWLIALISLVLAPVALLVFFELQFLPYHHEWITWWQRLAVGIDLLLIWLFWPAIALRQEVEQEPTRRRPVAVIQRLGTIGSMYAISGASVLLVGVVATFPGERLEAVLDQHVNPTVVREALVAVREALVAGKVDTARRKPESLWSNRLVLPGLELKIAAASETASLRARNLEGAVLIGAGLRKVDFTGANLRGAHLDKADLRDAKLDCALPFPEGSQDNRDPVFCVQLEGASLIETQLQGASLDGAQLQATSLDGAQLQGASLDGVFIWRLDSKNSNLTNARIKSFRLDQVVWCDDDTMNWGCAWTPQTFRELRDRDKIYRKVHESHGRTLALNWIDKLDPDKPFLDEERIVESWRALISARPSTSAYEAEVAKQWQQAGCAVEGSPYVVSRLITKMASDSSPFAGDSQQSVQLAAAFLAETCKGAQGLSERDIAVLQNLSVRRSPTTKSP
jgi:hypothetical protein